MIVELGHFFLALSLMMASLGAGLPLWGAAKDKTAFMRVARPASCGLFLCLTLAFTALLWAYETNDFSVAVVVANSHTAMPRIYRLAAAWGNHEGSMLLWVWLLSLWGFIFAHRPCHLPFMARTIGCQNLISLGFLAFILCTSNPFRRLSPPAPEGLGLNPLLQDPALALHPPLLYTGYVGFSLAFCCAIAGLLGQDVDRPFAHRLRPWVLTAWAALTAGITLGSLWAYYELGWGGFWFWDPVENTALLPWLAGTALLHALMILSKRGDLRGWTLFLCLLSFSFSLLGTFLVRSGLLTSVHAFAVDPLRGSFILVLLALAIGGGFAVFAWRFPSLLPNQPFSLFSRETFILANNLFLFTACMTVAIGTLYPLFMTVFDLPPLAVGTPYYILTLTPLLIPFALFMGMSLSTAWHRHEPHPFIRRGLIPLIAAAITPLALTGFDLPTNNPYLFIGMAAALWIGAGTLQDFICNTSAFSLSRAGKYLSHLGFALFLMGAAAATQGAKTATIWMSPGDHLTFANHTVASLGLHTAVGENSNIDRMILDVRHHDGTSFFLAPEKRWYPIAQQETSEASLHRQGLDIFMAILGERDKTLNTRFVVRLYDHPLMVLVFAGGLIMALGAAFSTLPHRSRA